MIWNSERARGHDYTPEAEAELGRDGAEIINDLIALPSANDPAA